MILQDDVDLLRCHARYSSSDWLLYCMRLAHHDGIHRCVRPGQPGAHAIVEWSDE